MAVSGKMFHLQSDVDDLTYDHWDFLDVIIQSKVEKAVEENNVKLFAEVKTQNQRIIDLELKVNE